MSSIHIMSLTYVVTGTSRGLGLEFVKQISAQGHTVFALARKPEESERLHALVDNKKVFSVKLDATSEQSIKEAVAKVERLAPEGIDVLINNAGVNHKAVFNVLNMNKDELLRILETNVGGVSDVTQHFLPLLRKRGQDKVKKILNISSFLGSISSTNVANPNGIKPAYCISKTALNMLTKLTASSLAAENFIVYSSHPGWVKTDMGGDDAPVEQVDSIAGMLEKLDRVTVEDNGHFFNYTGEELPW